jgi:hypothetical protein
MGGSLPQCHSCPLLTSLASLTNQNFVLAIDHYTVYWDVGKRTCKLIDNSTGVSDYALIHGFLPRRRSIELPYLPFTIKKIDLEKYLVLL